MNEVSAEMKFQRSTLHMSIVYTDRYFAHVGHLVENTEFQTIGVTALYIAAKLEEIFVPDIRIFSQSTGYSASSKQIAELERKML